jgi:hypothetical protein
MLILYKWTNLARHQATIYAHTNVLEKTAASICGVEECAIFQTEHKWKLHTEQTINWRDICQVAFQLDTEFPRALFLVRYF